MLPSDLLIARRQGETLIPKRLAIAATTQTLAKDYIDTFEQYRGKTQGELDRHFADKEGDSPDYRLLRGLVHLLKRHFATFEICSPLDPPLLRQRIFTLASPPPLTNGDRQQCLNTVAAQLSHELQQEVLPDQVELGLYADLPENQRLTEFDPPTPDTLIHRYNLSQVQGIFYRAQQMVIHAHRNDPGEYKLLFRYLKLFQLMTYIEGDADTGFTITIDGPTSLFKASTRYGLAIAKLLPALLHVTKWQLQAQLEERDNYSGQIKRAQFRLDDQCDLVSHYPPGKAYDSLLEESFAKGWEKLDTPWQLEREVDLIPIPGSVMIPDFRLVHPDGRVYLLEIVGYWRPEYLRKKFAQAKKAEHSGLIFAISERLKLDKAGVKVSDLSLPVIWFKDKLVAKKVLELLDSLSV